MNARTKTLLGTAIPGLLFLLVYNWVHTGDLLSRYVDPEWVGDIAALGIEAIVISLSIQIGMMRQEGRKPGFFVGVLCASCFSIASISVKSDTEINGSPALTNH